MQLQNQNKLFFYKLAPDYNAAVRNCKNLQKVIHFCDFLLLLSFLILPSQRVIFVVNDYGLCIHMSFQLAL